MFHGDQNMFLVTLRSVFGKTVDESVVEGKSTVGSKAIRYPTKIWEYCQPDMQQDKVKHPSDHSCGQFHYPHATFLRQIFVGFFLG